MKKLLAITLTILASTNIIAAEYFTAMSNRGNVHCHEVRNPSNIVWIQYRQEIEAEARENARRLARAQGYTICQEDSMIVKKVAALDGGQVCGVEATLLCGN